MSKQEKFGAPCVLNLSSPALSAESTSWRKILISEALTEYLFPWFISVREAVLGTTNLRSGNLAQTSEVTINHVNVSCITDVVCRIWSLVIYPNHHHISAPNLSANTLFKFSSLEKSFCLTVKSTLNWENGPNDIMFHCNCLLLHWRYWSHLPYFIMTYILAKYERRPEKLNIFLCFYFIQAKSHLIVEVSNILEVLLSFFFCFGHLKALDDKTHR